MVVGKRLASVEQRLHVHVRHLDRLEILDDEGRPLLVLFVDVAQRDNAPYAARQKLLELANETV